MDQSAIAAAAERVSERRARSLPVLLVLFVSQQATFFLGVGMGSGDRPIHHVQLVAWLSMCAVMLLLLTGGGAWFQSRAVRRLANDETTRAHRAAALSSGFVMSMVACMVIYIVALTQPVSAREAVHLVMSIGIGSALLRFALLERRAVAGHG